MTEIAPPLSCVIALALPKQSKMLDVPDVSSIQESLIAALAMTIEN